MMAYWGWFIAAAVVTAVELMTGTFYLLAVAVALAIGGIVAWFGASLPIQCGAAAVLGVGLVIAVHQWRLRRALPPPQQPFDIGQTVKVLAWNDDGTARVMHRGSQWTAQPERPETPRAESMVIVGMKGSTLVIGALPNA